LVGWLVGGVVGWWGGGVVGWWGGGLVGWLVGWLVVRNFIGIFPPLHIDETSAKYVAQGSRSGPKCLVQKRNFQSTWWAWS